MKDVKIQGELFERENDLRVKLPINFFNNILKCVDNKNFPVVLLEFFEGNVRVRLYSTEMTEYLHVRASCEDLEIINPGYLVVDVSNFHNYVKKFNGAVEINWKQGGKINISDEEGNEAEIVPSDIKPLGGFVPPENRIFPSEKDVIYHPLKDEKGDTIIEDGKPVMLPMTTMAYVHPNELSKGIGDMKIARSDYVIYTFGPETSFSSSGQYNKEENSAKSTITAKVEGDQIEAVLPNLIENILQNFTGEILVQISDKYPMVFFTEKIEDDTSVIDLQVGIVQYKPKDKKKKKPKKAKKE